MAKLNWEIHSPYGHQFDVVANTRATAIAIAEAKYLEDMAWEDELVTLETGFVRSAIPEYRAIKIV